MVSLEQAGLGREKLSAAPQKLLPSFPYATILSHIVAEKEQSPSEDQSRIHRNAELMLVGPSLPEDKGLLFSHSLVNHKAPTAEGEAPVG